MAKFSSSILLLGFIFTNYLAILQGSPSNEDIEKVTTVIGDLLAVDPSLIEIIAQGLKATEENAVTPNNTKKITAKALAIQLFTNPQAKKIIGYAFDMLPKQPVANAPVVDTTGTPETKEGWMKCFEPTYFLIKLLANCIYTKNKLSYIGKRCNWADQAASSNPVLQQHLATVKGIKSGCKYSKIAKQARNDYNKLKKRLNDSFKNDEEIKKCLNMGKIATNQLRQKLYSAAVNKDRRGGCNGGLGRKSKRKCRGRKCKRNRRRGRN